MAACLRRFDPVHFFSLYEMPPSEEEAHYGCNMAELRRFCKYICFQQNMAVNAKVLIPVFGRGKPCG